jgi:hypothetical protein
VLRKLTLQSYKSRYTSVVRFGGQYTLKVSLLITTPFLRVKVPNALLAASRGRTLVRYDTLAGSPREYVK